MTALSSDALTALHPAARALVDVVGDMAVRVLDFLKIEGAPATSRQIAEALALPLDVAGQAAVSLHRVERALFELTAVGAVHRSLRPSPGRPVWLYVAM